MKDLDIKLRNGRIASLVVDGVGISLRSLEKIQFKCDAHGAIPRLEIILCGHGNNKAFYAKDDSENGQREGRGKSSAPSS
jgi:hypothetical protein